LYYDIYKTLLEKLRSVINRMSTTNSSPPLCPSLIRIVLLFISVRLSLCIQFNQRQTHPPSSPGLVLGCCDAQNVQ